MSACAPGSGWVCSRLCRQVRLGEYYFVGTTLTASKAYYFGGAYETHSDGAIRKYYSLAGQTIAMRAWDVALGTWNLTYFLTDHLGSTLTVLDDQGAVHSEQRYLPFGAVRDDVGTITQTDFGYTFQRALPDTGLMDYKARFYSQRLGKFIQPDTLVPGPANPQSWNRYSYVGNSPINFSDPTGHMRIQDGNQNDRLRSWLVDKYVPIRRARFDSELLPPKDEKEAPWEYKTTVHWGIHLGPAQYINAPDFYGDTPNGPNICVGANGWAAALCAATIPLSFPFTVGPKSYRVPKFMG